MNSYIKKNLRIQLLCAVLISLAASIFVFVVSWIIGNAILENTIYSNSFEKKTVEREFTRLQTYIKDESITYDNLHRLNAWCSLEEKLYITIYRDDKLLYESSSQKNNTYEYNDTASYYKFDPDNENPDNRFILTLADNTKVQAFIYYYSNYLLYFFITAISFLLAFIAFSLCFAILINKKISYIKLLKYELDILSGGQLEYNVTVNGEDELGILASGIDEMRRSIIRHQEIENQMRSDNSELITSMSHDLRTPLTSLMAYLEIIKRKKYSDEQQMYDLIDKSIDQTLRIRNMADTMFEYFLVYATEWECSEMEKLDSDQLFKQIFNEYAYPLNNHGFDIDMHYSPLSGEINANMELLHRVFDNIYSNLLKYASPEKNIIIYCQEDNNQVIITIFNTVSENHKVPESTNIGLKTCSRIIQYHGGEFSSSQTDNTFTVILKLPIAH